MMPWLRSSICPQQPIRHCWNLFIRANLRPSKGVYMSLPLASSSARANAIPERVEIWDIARLIPSARHARTHSLEQIAEIARSIETYGFMTRVLVDVDGLIIAGHARVLAARELRLERIPVVVIDHLSEAEKRAYAIADNQIALHAGWDDSLLQIELAALQAEG